MLHSRRGLEPVSLLEVAWPAVALMLAAGVALLRYKIGVIPVIATCAVLGLLLRLSGLA